MPECPTVHHVSTHFITSHYDIGLCPVFSREDPKLGFWCPEPHFLAFWICTSLPSEVWFWKLYSAIGRNEVFILSGSSSSSPSSGMWSSMTMSDQRSVPALSSPYYQNQNPSPLWIWNNLLICTLQNCMYQLDGPLASLALVFFARGHHFTPLTGIVSQSGSSWSPFCVENAKF